MKKLICFLCIICSLHVAAQKKIMLVSPDGNIVFDFHLKDGNAYYNVIYKKNRIVNDSKLSLNFQDGNFENDLIMHKPVWNDSVEDYDLVVGKTKHVHDVYNEVTIKLEQKTGNHRKVNLVVKAFKDGLAFKYYLPTQAGWNNFILTDENTTFNLANNPIVHALLRENYTTSHEGFYTTVALNDLTADTLLDMPATFEFPNHIYVAITEAALLDYAGMYLSKHNGVLTSKLSPLPAPLGDGGIKVKADVPHSTPWRVLLISDRIGALVESNILTDLNAPCAIKDVSWIHPGKSDFHWWNGDIIPDTTISPGINFDFTKYYIDFCANNHIDYHTVIGYGGFAWYKSDAADYGVVGPHTDVTQTVPSLDMQQVCDYAAKKGVGIRVWVNWKAIYPDLERSFTQFEKWGLKGMMVDFLDRDDQEMVNIQTEILQKAAEHHLHIQFHGAYKPTGLSRTYPNEYTREGTLNYEVDKWSDSGVSADHDINMPFTRMLAGSTDYHLGGFRAATQQQFKTQFTRPLVLGTRCHMLAMYVVLENYLQMVCDYPAAYEGQPGFEFIQQIPTTWDETKVLDATEAFKYITIARRSNNDWYVGTITNHEPRNISIPLNFLNDGNYTAEIYTDANDVNVDPNHLNKQTKTVTNKDVINLHVAGSGGEVMRLIKQVN